jgi:hypothetical protein
MAIVAKEESMTACAHQAGFKAKLWTELTQLLAAEDAIRLVKIIPVNYGIRFSGPVTRPRRPAAFGMASARAPSASPIL